jgi:arsenate reductase (thioredoxin)
VGEPQQFRVLFICIGNSCRSQMAEGFARFRYPDLMAAMSAGLLPAPIVQPQTIEVMAEAGIPIEDQKPKPIRDVDWKAADVVVNMSGSGILQMLPGYEGGNLIWPVPDPMGRSMRKYRRVRDQIEDLVDNLARSLRRQMAD